MALRAGIIGCGGIAVSHLKALGHLPEVTVAACADRDADRLASFADRCPGATPHAEALEMLQQGGLDLVTIATNGPSHAALTIAAAKAGVRHLMCEKPMATSVDDAAAMLEACQAAGARLAINHTRRWSPNHASLARALAEGIIGRPRAWLITLGAGRLGCNATHMVDLVRMLSGQEIVSVSGWLDRSGTPDPRGPEFTDPGGHAVMHLADGGRVYLDQMEDVGVPPAIEVLGSIGRARLEDGSHLWQVRAREDAQRNAPMLSYGLPLVEQPFEASERPRIGEFDEVLARAYRDLLHGTGEPACSGTDGLRAIEAVLAIHLSDSRGHTPVALPLTGADRAFGIPFT